MAAGTAIDSKTKAAARGAKAGGGKKSTAKAAGAKQPTKAEAQKRAEALDKKQKESGYTSAEARERRKLAEQLEHDVPSWAQTDAQRKSGGASANGGQRNVTRAKDPEAVELAKEAKALAPDVKSAFLPKDARAFIDEVAAGKTAAALLTVEPEGDDDKGTTISVAALERFAVKGEKDQDVRRHLTRLGKGTRLWGRKLGLFILAQHARDKK